MIVNNLTESPTLKFDYQNKDNVHSDDSLCIANKTGSGLSDGNFSCTCTMYTGQDHASRPAEVKLLPPPSREMLSQLASRPLHCQPVHLLAEIQKFSDLDPSSSLPLFPFANLS